MKVFGLAASMVAVLFGVAMTTGTAMAQGAPNNLPITGFYGSFLTDDPARGLPRIDLDRPGTFGHHLTSVEIKGTSSGFSTTFGLTYQTVAPGSPMEVQNTTQTLVFEKVASADPATPYWRAVGTGDAVDGGETIWAYVHDRTLVINSFKVLRDGRHLLAMTGLILDDGLLELQLFLDYAGQNRRQARGELYEKPRQ